MRLPVHVEQRLFETSDAAARGLAQSVAHDLRQALAERPQASLLVSGGRSPIPFFQALSVEKLDWSKVVVSLADERWVTPSQPDSNGRLVEENLLRNAAAAAHWLPLKTADATPEDGIPAIERAMVALPLPVDVLVLGVGEDGHTASLFPCADETPLAMTSDRLVAAIHPRTAPHARVTFTLPILLQARSTFVAIAGQSKREVLERAVAAVPPLPSGEVLLASRGAVHVFWSP